MKISTFPQGLVNILVLVCLALFSQPSGLVSPVTWLLLAEMFPEKLKHNLCLLRPLLTG